MRVASVLAAVGVTSVLAACGSSDSSTSSSATASSGTTGAEAAGDVKGANVTFVSALKGNPGFIPLECGLQDEAKKLGMNVELTGPPTPDPVAQASILRSLVAKKPAAVIVDATDQTAIVGALEQLHNAGVKIIEVDAFTKFDKASGRVGVDDVGLGEKEGHLIAEALGEKGIVQPFLYNTGFTTSLHRQEGIEKALKEYPNIKVLPVQYSQGDAGRVSQIIEATKVKYPNDTIGLTDDGSFTGEIFAAQLADPGAREGLKAVSIDTTPKLVEGLKSGAMSGLLAQPFYQEGTTAMQAAADAIAGKPVEPLVKLDATVVTMDNVDSPEVKQATATSC